MVLSNHLLPFEDRVLADSTNTLSLALTKSQISTRVGNQYSARAHSTILKNYTLLLVTDYLAGLSLIS